MTNVSKFNNQSMGEEIGNAVTHGVGALLAVAGTAVMIVRACAVSDAIGVVSACIYGSSMIFLYTMSCLYHALTNLRAKKVFQVFDHCSIFLLIIGSYTPICLSLLRGALGWTLWGVNAGLAALGITFNAISVRRWHKASLVLYLLMGWSVVVAAVPLMHSLTPAGMALLVGGGLLYSAGVPFYRAEKPRYMHFIWHFFVLGGSILHYFFILFYALPL
ncbi:MAG: hemolysin III family protein [Oscillospiraceae bacterium]|nr:hemolysin III family protein [Oscillospiraceae bacterium]